jgi:SH3 domain-containing YSC84-like protein 1
MNAEKVVHPDRSGPGFPNMRPLPRAAFAALGKHLWVNLRNIRFEEQLLFSELRPTGVSTGLPSKMARFMKSSLSLEDSLQEAVMEAIVMVKKFVQVVCISAALTLAASAADTQKLDQRIAAAHAVLHELMATPDKGIPDDIAAKATCVAVIPGFKKGAFIFGGQYGQGVVSCRTGHGWSAPAFIQMTGASFGLQAGGQSTDLVLVAINHNGFQRLLKDKVKLGGDVSVAAGPVGRNSQASTTELANAALLSYSRNKGIFAGVDLTGDVVNQNQDDTRAYYGKDVSYEAILTGRVPIPPSARHFVRTVSELFHARARH